MKKMYTLAMVMCFVAMFAGNVFAWGDGTDCVQGQFGTAAINTAGSGAGADNFGVIFCNIYNAIDGYIGATIALLMIAWGIYQGAFARGGVVAAIPFVIMGLLLSMAPSIITWLGVPASVVKN